MKKSLLYTAIAGLMVSVASTILFSGAAKSDEIKRQPKSELRVGRQSTDERRAFMRSKLAMVQQVVEGIATEDFEMIQKGGMELAALAESANFRSANDPYYKHYSANFEHAVRGLIGAAESKSVEKATFAYVHVTISCTACHQHVRGTVRTAQ